jgi:cyanophycinase-like exopeptidase
MHSKNLLFLLLCPFFLTAQGGYTNWIVGDTSDYVAANPMPGIVLAGGAGDNDQAMQWMLERADGGDVLILRASGSNGYNDYFFEDLGVSTHSVETIRFDNASAATDTYVLRRIEEAEVLFLAGGDQFDYYTYWKDNGIEERINHLLNVKQITVGGTSAGMAVLGGAYYTPSSSGIISDEALSNPYHPFMDILGKGDFLDAPFLEHVVTDTHFDQRNRSGRLTAFLARLTKEHGQRMYGISCNEYTAVCIDENGLARAFGEYPEFEEDQVYFLQVNCQGTYAPETCEAGTPLHWLRDQQAVKVYKVPALITGANTFDLTDWTTGSGGGWEDWFVDEGELFQVPDADPADCQAVSTVAGIDQPSAIRLSPNPFSNFVTIETSHSGVLELIDLQGKVWVRRELVEGQHQIDVSGLPKGFFIAVLQSGTSRNFYRVEKF